MYDEHVLFYLLQISRYNDNIETVPMVSSIPHF